MSHTADRRRYTSVSVEEFDDDELNPSEIGDSAVNARNEESQPADTRNTGFESSLIESNAVTLPRCNTQHTSSLHGSMNTGLQLSALFQSTDTLPTQNLSQDKVRSVYTLNSGNNKQIQSEEQFNDEEGEMKPGAAGVEHPTNQDSANELRNTPINEESTSRLQGVKEIEMSSLLPTKTIPHRVDSRSPLIADDASDNPLHSSLGDGLHTDFPIHIDTPLQESATSGLAVLEPKRSRPRTVWGLMRRMSWNQIPLEVGLGSIREEEDDDDDDPLMEAMDNLEEFEDEIDEHTYDDLIPLQLRMALEDQVFGWDHFMSIFLGHIIYTLGSYLVTFWLITFVVLHEVPWGTPSGEGGGGEDDTCGSGCSKSNPWGMPHSVFAFLRTSLSLLASVSTFRTIRRRRRVWLRRPYSKSDLSGSDAERRQHSLEEADQRARRFVLGSRLWNKMKDSYASRRDRYLSRRVNRKLLKAHRMFERRHRNRVKKIRHLSSSSLTELSKSADPESAHERVRMLAASPVRKKKHQRSNPSSLGMTASTDSSGDDDTAGSSASLTEDEQRSRYPAMNSNTLPNFALESVGHDQMPFSSGEIKRVPYVHGGFFGAAPFMLTNPHWIAILRLLMPDVYVEISRRASYAPAPKLIHWAENNPVVAAYGSAHEIEFSGSIPTLEWDVFVDPHLVWRLEIVLSEKESFLQRQ